MSVLSRQDFDEAYQEAVRTVFRHWTPRMQDEMAVHCYPWGTGRYDFRRYLEASSVRYYHAFEAIASAAEGRRVCDVGGFWGAFPVALRSLGYDVTMTEAIRYYGRSFDDLFDCIRDAGVRVVDFDPFRPDCDLPGQFDAVCGMAVLEHYPHSLKHVMANLLAMMTPRGILYIEVPNIAYWPKRAGLLRGRTPLPTAADIFRSEIPFLGHHHEFTLAELRELAGLVSLEIVRENLFTYSPETPVWKRMVRHPVSTLIQIAVPEARECIGIACRKKAGGRTVL